MFLFNPKGREFGSLRNEASMTAPIWKMNLSSVPVLHSFTVSFFFGFTVNSHPQGQFIQTMQYGGHWYGLSRESIERVAREGLACCVHMELEVWQHVPPC